MATKAASTYDGSSIEVLEGLEPVRRRPGMYTDTTSPNHLGMEVIDNSVDEALAGFATHIDVMLHSDDSLEVIDNGRGMPVDLHPTEKVPAVELIFGRLHAGGKFNSDNYGFSGGLHGVGVSVVNALSLRLEARIQRGGKIYQIAYENGNKVEELHTIGTCPKGATGTAIRFWPDGSYFDSKRFNLKALMHLLKAKAVLCPNLSVHFVNEATGEEFTWTHEGSLGHYLLSQCSGRAIAPMPPYSEVVTNADSEVAFAVAWELEGSERVRESFVNLIPTAEGGTHVNGLRSGLLAAMREFCDLHNLLPRGLKLVPDDVWAACSFVLSVKMRDPQFAGQTKERLSSRECASLVESAVKDRFSLYLNANVDTAKEIAELIIQSAKRREASAKVVERKKATRGPQLPGKLVDCTSTDPSRSELFIVEGDSAGGSARRHMEASLLHLILHITRSEHPLVIKHLREDPFQRVVAHPATFGPVWVFHGDVSVIADVESRSIAVTALARRVCVKVAQPRDVVLRAQDRRNDQFVERNTFRRQRIEESPRYMRQQVRRTGHEVRY